MSKPPRRPRAPRIATVDNPEGADDLGAAPLSDPRSPAERAAEMDEVEILNTLRSGAGNGGYVRLERRIDGSLDYAMIGRIEIADFKPEEVMRTYGGGYYKVGFYSADHKRLGLRRLTIDPTIPYKNPAAPAVPVAAVPAAGMDIVAILKQLQEVKPAGTVADAGTSTMMQFMLAKMASDDKRFEIMMGRQTGPDPFMLKLFEMATSKPTLTPQSEFLENLMVMKKFMGAGKGGGDDEDEPEGFMEKLIHVGKPLMGALGEGLAARFAGVELPGGNAGQPAAIEAGAENGAEDRTAPVKVVNGHPAKPAPAGAKSTMHPLVRMQINSIRADLIKVAPQKPDPIAVAQAVAEEIPGKYFDTVYAMAKADDWFQQLFGASPEAMAHKEWLTLVRNELLVEIGPDQEDETNADDSAEVQAADKKN